MTFMTINNCKSKEMKRAFPSKDKEEEEEGEDDEEEEEEEEEEDAPLEPKTFGRRNRGLLRVCFLAPGHSRRWQDA
jgi:hypothetical protein